MYLWRRLAAPQWLLENEEILRSRAGDQLAITERPNRKRLQLEVACDPEKGRKLLAEFGGRLEQLSRDWLKRFCRNRQSKPLRVGERLVITNVGGTSVSRGSRHPIDKLRVRRSQTAATKTLIIPAGAAFGTGEHVTTVLSLRLLERAIKFRGAHAPSRAGDDALGIANFGRTFRRGRRKSEPDWRLKARRVRSPEIVLDIGTGSGILALAAKCLGAKHVIGIDIDPIAVATAKQNMRLNKIDHVDFRVADVRKWRPTAKIDIISANLFSELLIESLPKLRRCLKRDGWLVLSGVLRDQEAELVHALRRNKIAIAQIRRRGKWVAVLAKAVEARALPAAP